MPLTPSAHSLARFLANAAGTEVLLDEEQTAAVLDIERDTLHRALARLRERGYIEYDPLPPGIGSKKLRATQGATVRRVVVLPALAEVLS